MIFNIYCASCCVDNGLPTQLSSCGVVIVYVDQVLIKKRYYSYGLGNSTKNLADVQSVRLALASIISKYRHIETNLHINSQYVMSMIEKHNGSYVKRPATNIDAIDKMRLWYQHYRKIKTHKANKLDENYITATQLAKTCLSSQQMTDTGTMEQ